MAESTKVLYSKLAKLRDKTLSKINQSELHVELLEREIKSSREKLDLISVQLDAVRIAIHHSGPEVINNFSEANRLIESDEEAVREEVERVSKVENPRGGGNGYSELMGFLIFFTLMSPLIIEQVNKYHRGRG